MNGPEGYNPPPAEKRDSPNPYEDLGPPDPKDDIERYRYLAKRARRSGDPELGKRLDAYAEDLNKERIDEVVSDNVDRAMHQFNAFKEGMINKGGESWGLYIGPQNGKTAKHVIPAIREQLLSEEGLQRASIERFERDNAIHVAYVAPLEDGLLYVEDCPLSKADSDFVEISVYKDENSWHTLRGELI